MISSFFTKLVPKEAAPEKRPRGRPSDTAKLLEAEKKSRLAEEEDRQFWLAAEAAQRDLQVEREEHERRHKKRPSGHTNWALPENLARLAPAVTGWLDGTAKKEDCTMRSWAEKHGVSKGTLSKKTKTGSIKYPSNTSS